MALQDKEKWDKKYRMKQQAISVQKSRALKIKLRTINDK